MKKMRIKGYSAIVRRAKQKVRIKGKVKIKGYAGAGYGGIGGLGYNTCGKDSFGAFSGPSLQERLLGWAVASTLVTVSLDTTSFRGRIISVDGNGFEVTVTDPLTSVFTVGAIVFVSFRQVNAISAGAI